MTVRRGPPAGYRRGASLAAVFVQRGRFQMMLDVRYERVPTIPGGPAWQLPVTLALRL